MATAADWMSAASFISMAGLIAFLGYDGSVYLMGWTGGYVLLALLLAPYLRKFGKFTVPEFIGERYYSQTARVVAVICLIVASFTYVSGRCRVVGIVSRASSRSISTRAVDRHGHRVHLRGSRRDEGHHLHPDRAVLRADFRLHRSRDLHLHAADRQPDTAAGLGSTMAERNVSARQARLIVTDLGFGTYTIGQGKMLNMFLYTLSLMIGTAGLPHVIIRFFTVPRVRDARYSAGWALVFIAILYTTAPAVGAMARLNLINTIQTGAVGAATATWCRRAPGLVQDLGDDRPAGLRGQERRWPDPVLQ